jgi:hypothetical protein
VTLNWGPTELGAFMGDYSFTMKVTMLDFPEFDDLVLQEREINFKVTSICDETKISSKFTPQDYIKGEIYQIDGLPANFLF